MGRIGLSVWWLDTLFNRLIKLIYMLQLVKLPTNNLYIAIIIIHIHIYIYISLFVQVHYIFKWAKNRLLIGRTGPIHLVT